MAFAAAFVVGGANAYNAWQQSKLKDQEAEALRDAGQRVMAAGTREYQEAQREKEYMHSRALALAAASGAGVDNPGMVKVLGDLNAEGEYRMLSTLWRAQNDAQGLYFRADAANREATAIFNAGMINAVVSAFSAYSTVGGSFGGGGPAVPPTAGTISSQGLPHSPVLKPARPQTIYEFYKGK